MKDRKVKLITPAGTTFYYYDGDRLLEERNNSNVVQKTYVYGTWLDDVITYNYNGHNYYLANDRQGSTLAVFNENVLAERNEYSGFGAPSFYNETYSQLDSSSVNNNILFTGRPYYASSTGNYDFRQRVYNFSTGRFLQKDPLGYINGYNTYAAYFIPHQIDPFGTNVIAIGGGALITIGILLETIGPRLLFILITTHGAYIVGKYLMVPTQNGTIMVDGLGELAGDRSHWVSGRCHDLHNDYDKPCDSKRSCKGLTCIEELREPLENAKACYKGRKDYLDLGCEDAKGDVPKRDLPGQLREARGVYEECQKRMDRAEPCCNNNPN